MKDQNNILTNPFHGLNNKAFQSFRDYKVYCFNLLRTKLVNCTFQFFRD